MDNESKFIEKYTDEINYIKNNYPKAYSKYETLYSLAYRINMIAKRICEYTHSEEYNKEKHMNVLSLIIGNDVQEEHYKEYFEEEFGKIYPQAKAINLFG